MRHDGSLGTHFLSIWNLDVTKVLDAWAYEAGVTLSFIRPGKPVENAYIESFNGRFRDECLNEHWFVSMRHVKRLIEEWRVEHNTERPHSSLGYLASKFSEGEPQAIVLSDSKMLKVMMESTGVYYYNAGKVNMHKVMFRKGLFEVPLVVPEGNNLKWIEGFHQVNAAIEMGMRIVPIGTSLALAQQLRSLIGVSTRNTVASPYDFSECDATVM